jgi:hypothetical protein
MNESPVLSFDAATKRKFTARARKHQLADEIIKGKYWEGGKGCAVGCLVHGESHAQLAEELGMPIQMAYLIDRLFEGMPLDKAKAFPLRFVKSLPVGKDLGPVMDRFLLALLSDPENGVMLSVSESVRPAIQTVIDLYTRQVAGDYPSREEWRAADSAAYSAAYSGVDSAAASAVYRAAYSAAASAAASAVYSAESSAESSAAASAAARAASRAVYRAVYRAAEENHYLWQSEMLISLLKSA